MDKLEKIIEILVQHKLVLICPDCGEIKNPLTDMSTTKDYYGEFICEECSDKQFAELGFPLD